MAVTRISDVVVPEVYQNYIDVYTKENWALYESGVLVADPSLSAFLSSGGRTVTVPFWKDLADEDSDVGNDDPASISVPSKLSTGKDVAIRQVRTKSWSSANLAADLAGDDPMAAIVRRTGNWWLRQFNTILVNTLEGVRLDNVANDSGDMVNDIGGDDGTVTSTELVSAEAILDTKQTMGDAAEDLKVIAMHSVVFTRLQKQNLIDFIPNARGEVMFPTYLGYRVVVSDTCKKIVGSNSSDVKYVTYLLGAGALAFTEVPLKTSPMVEVHREPLQGGGVGVDTLITRRQFVMHPYGIKFTDASVAAEFPTNTELGTAANWDRVFPERKQIPLAFLLTNG